MRIPVKRRARSGGTVRSFQRKRRSRSIPNGVKRRPFVLSASGRNSSQSCGRWSPEKAAQGSLLDCVSHANAIHLQTVAMALVRDACKAGISIGVLLE